jgi:hypothetical protein
VDTILSQSIGRPRSVKDLKAPKGAGAKEELVISGLLPNQAYWIGIMVFDDAENSSFSNIVSVITGSSFIKLTPE